MIKREDLVIVYLSACLLFAQCMWLKAERKAAYNQGRLDGLLFQMVDDDQGQIHKTLPKKERW